MIPFPLSSLTLSTDFIYTGDFEYTSVPRPNELEGLKHLLYELLALLLIADEWDMPDLMNKVESEIIHKHDFVQRLLPLHQESGWRRIEKNSRISNLFKTVLEVAERSNANNLKAALNKMAEHNGELLKRFTIGFTWLRPIDILCLGDANFICQC